MDLIVRQPPAEYFRELVGETLRRQRVETDQLTTYYLVNLLCQFVRPNARSGRGLEEESLAIQLGRALQSGGSEQRLRLRCLGDWSLFVSGFFSDSLRRRVVDVDYYVSMGEYAYGSLSNHDAIFGDVFGELSSKFITFMDVLAEISEQGKISNDGDLFRLYEKWVRTGSKRLGRKLVDRGIVPNSSVGNRFIQ
jgi:hypothetical protein